MDFYSKQIVIDRRLHDLRREADEYRLARRARVSRDGTVGFTQRIASAISAAATRVAAATPVMQYRLYTGHRA